MKLYVVAVQQKMKGPKEKVEEKVKMQVSVGVGVSPAAYSGMKLDDQLLFLWRKAFLPDMIILRNVCFPQLTTLPAASSYSFIITYKNINIST